ncbi:NYN domain-containing protein [Crenobacter sp. SG2303]|uniref:NYN domain-containing protein n=1 Tax=Crenobacter oryzisoli TaxID=3056844 RepID=A0ABT7XPM8_9NEIS|nr:NYN domain-containing protein [Crenobacter sp. SG2303]MDN0075715.1 NYN domain-containing protein [Crenobacter sp. SG2303]
MANVAVLIDADNVSPSWIENVLTEATKLGSLALKRVYGDFSRQDKTWRELCARLAIQPIQQFPNTKGKNASDIAMVIDAMDLLHSGRYESFCLVSSDSDFSRLATRLREDGGDVWGFGELKAPEAFVKACSKFVYVEILEGDEEDEEDEREGDEPVTDHLQRLKLPIDRQLKAALREAVQTASDEEGWAQLGGVGSLITKRLPDFDSRNYGYAKLSSLIKAVGLFEVVIPNDGNNRSPLVRLKLGRSRGGQ